MIENAIREAMLVGVPELMAAIRAELERPRMLPIKSAPVAYRALLDAERRGELTIYRVGHASLVDEAELYAWIRRFGVARAEPEAVDEVGKLIAIGDSKRRGRRG